MTRVKSGDIEFDTLADGHFFTPERFREQTMIVTGAARGIGAATALRAAREGARVVLADVLDAEGEALAARLSASSYPALYVHADVSDAGDVERMVRAAVDAFGGLDVAINNAGIIGTPAPIHLADEQASFRHTLDVNLVGVFLCCREELKVFVRQRRGGSIVNVSSIAGLTGLPGNVGYTASKHGVCGLTRTVAMTYASQGIRCNAVCPAGTSTPMVEEAMRLVQRAGGGAGDGGSMVIPGAKSRGLIAREATADEQAGTLLYIASNEATHITGALIASDNGWTAF